MYSTAILRVVMHVTPPLRDNFENGCEGIAFNYRCGRRGHCLEYDHDGLAQVLVGVFVTCKLITTVCFFLSWFFCRRLQATEKLKDVNNEKQGEEEEAREALTGDSGKILICNLETAM